jgi:ATP-binding cassette subfamily C (CFTR/MRP) protein 1
MQVVVLCMAEKWLTMLFPACMLLVYLVQKVYLRTSRQLRYLELEARASVFSSFLESVGTGIPTETSRKPYILSG